MNEGLVPEREQARALGPVRARLQERVWGPKSMQEQT